VGPSRSPPQPPPKGYGRHRTPPPW
jgi:hypothetical protein